MFGQCFSLEIKCSLPTSGNICGKRASKTGHDGYDEINFAAFAMLGKDFSPKIKNIKSQWLYKINAVRDYGSLNALLKDLSMSSPKSPSGRN
jgi:hypothetical protein